MKSLCLLALCAGVALAGQCPSNLDPYRDEPSPFGWPLTPGGWEFEHQECWASSYEQCAGSRQSPVALHSSCLAGATPAGSLAGRASYRVVAGSPKVSISEYMRTAAVAGEFGTLRLKDSSGHDVEYRATQVHLTAGSLHQVDGAEADAEMLVIHEIQGAARGSLPRNVILSLLFREGATPSGLFAQLGFPHDSAAGADHVDGRAWEAPSAIDLNEELASALRGNHYAYEGSVPVPPCSEDVAYIVLAEHSTVHASQVGALKQALTAHAGGWRKREVVRRDEVEGQCHEVRANSLEAVQSQPHLPEEEGEWSITGGSGGCVLVGDCVQTDGYPSSYGDRQSCTVSITGRIAVTVEHFETEPLHDVLTFNGNPYSGGVGPANGVVSGEISWASDRNTAGSGWRICKTFPKGCSRFPAAINTSSAHAMHSPVAFGEASGDQKVDVGKHMHYKDASHVTMHASETSLDWTGDFGYLLLNGRRFDARKVSFRPLSQHTIDGVRYAGELVIEHTLWADAQHSSHRRLVGQDGDHSGDDHAGDHSGDDYAGPDDHPEANHSTGEHTGDHAEDDDGHAGGGDHDGHATRTVPTGQLTVTVSVPLALGREGALLRELGIGVDVDRSTVQAGQPLVIEGTVHLGEWLRPSSSRSWFWYSAQSSSAACADQWGGRHIVLKEPLDVSLEQLNALGLKVSGFDSVMPPQQPETGFIANSYVPEDGLEPGGSCDADHLGYHNPSCWKASSPICRDGTAQSPINIDSSALGKTGGDSFLARVSWKPVSGLRVVHGSAGLEIGSDQLGYSRVTGSDGYPKFYQARKVQLHTPSEHLIDGKQYPLELQIIHHNQKTVLDFDENDVLTTSVMFEFGEESKLLKQFLHPEEDEHGRSVINQPVDLMWALGSALESPYFAYQGSHTAPGCGEEVQWVVFEKPMALSQEQWSGLKALFPTLGNNRPVQRLSGRSVMKGTLDEAAALDDRFFLNRDTSHNRMDKTPPHFIVIPIAGTLLLCSTIMFAIFQREDKHLLGRSAGGTHEETASILGKSA